MKKVLIALFFFSAGCEDAKLGYVRVPCSATSPNINGAYCHDGTSSKNHGSMTCANHGGVKTWICGR